MKLSKIRHKLEALLISEAHKGRKKVRKIEELLESLARREKKLRKRFANQHSDIARQAIREELEVIHKQKRKGKKALKSLNS